MQHLQDVIGGPRECLRVDSADAYRRRVREIRAGMGLDPTLRMSPYELPAHVSQGRWVFDCPCGSAGLASREWGLGICPDCGVETAIAFPEHAEAAEAVLLARPRVVDRDFIADASSAAKRRVQPTTVLALARSNRLEGDAATRRTAPKAGR